ncbi:sodium:calcium antiporter [Alicyclobacillus fastidiosus]|uniref:Sodium:calcium antiporter n=1 Tax=Alicyclobacillus fastidiosus TaxID=392011 RepID=A0ABY6ZLJ0_9BACL|nr:sodium:calcium antiporter [Alicyclobacillus fastidiosus]WAH43707.1 sodium:calcium antiporter [Alicyclobacillus fastidiosus]GMA59915.1 membrane protein [Alicyclobacillus fastidiosus]
MIWAVQMIFSLAMILFGAELFTNAVEWLGRKLGLGQGAIGSVLAAVGTALPETAVPVTAILFGRSHEAQQVGIGGILGAPFLLATLGSLVMAVALLSFRAKSTGYILHVGHSSYRRDNLCFLVAYALAMVAGLVPTHAVHQVVPFLLILVYLAFIVMTVCDKSDRLEEDELRPLYIQPKSTIPSITLVFVQLFFALALIVGGAHTLTGGVERIAVRVGLPTFVLSALIIPLATELPETLNSVVWIRQGKDSLAAGNITGAMVFQSTLVPALGIWMTPWNFTGDALLTAFLTLMAALFTFAMSRLHGRVTPWMLLVASSLYWVLPMQTMASRYGLHRFYWLFGVVIGSSLLLAFISDRRANKLRY